MRYISLPKREKSSDEYWEPRLMPPLAHPQVFVSDPVKTGLIDSDGNDIYRLPDAIGFLARKR